MKKIYGFLGAVAILSMVACSKDADLGGPQGPEAGSKGDFFMTMNIAHKSETRTQTPNQGYEVGKDFENKINSAMLIIANASTKGYEIFAVSDLVGPTGIVGDASPGAAGSGHTGTPDSNGSVGLTPTHNNTYKISVTFDRNTLLNDISSTGSDASSESVPGYDTPNKKKEYNIFVVANPPAALQAAINKAVAQNATADEKDLQKIFTLTANDDTFWSKTDGFLMSSADVAKHTIYDVEIEKGTHTTKAEAYDLGTVYVQRAMSRFDLDVTANHVTFEGAGDNSAVGQSTLPNIKVTFDAVALVNMAKSAYLFKTMALNNTALNNKTINFGDERQSSFAEWWVFTPDQYTTVETTNTYSFYNPLFETVQFNGTSLDNNTTLTSPEDAGAKAFSELFDGVESDATWRSITTIQSNLEDESFEHEGHTPSTEAGFRIWRYAMENTNPDIAANQKNGNSTGIVFRAKLENTTGSNVIPTEGQEAIYAYNNVIIGTAARLKEFATNPQNDDAQSPVYQSVKTIYNAVIQALLDANKKPAQEGKEWDLETDGYVNTTEGTDWFETKEGDNINIHYGRQSDLDKKLVEQGFLIYRPTPNAESKPVYYCYYLYWNRHNDNGDNTQMGTMEFATVRNNVYKIRVNKIVRLGHPGEPDDDPDTPDPDDPDEKDEFWLEVSCEILPWEVRINEIEF